MPELQAAINRNATVYLFGEPYNDMQGIHDVHMNQGSKGRFQGSNGIWQDGGIIIYFPDEDRYDAIFLAFASQAVHTDETNGHALPGSQNLAQLLGHQDGGGDIQDDLRIAIVAALINPIGPENQANFSGRPEMVYVINQSQNGIALRNWSLLNKNDEAHVLSGDIWLGPTEVQSVTMGTVPLSNKGGLISLLDENGNKVDGVSYTKKQAGKEGNLLIFR